MSTNGIPNRTSLAWLLPTVFILVMFIIATYSKHYIREKMTNTLSGIKTVMLAKTSVPGRTPCTSGQGCSPGMGKTGGSSRHEYKLLPNQTDIGCGIGARYSSQGLHFHCVENITMTLNDSAGEAMDKLYRYLNRIHVECRDNQWLGNLREGGWDVCLSGPYKFGKPCHVISIGIRHDWTFDAVVAKKFGCRVDAFDPSVGNSTSDGTMLADNIHFWHRGVYSKTTIAHTNWNVYTLKDLIQPVTKQHEILDYIKFDIEGDEWGVLNNVLFDNTLATRFKQIAFEVHMTGNTTTQMYIYWKLFSTLEKVGFARWTYFVNPYPPCVQTPSGKQFCQYINLNYINTRFLLEQK